MIIPKHVYDKLNRFQDNCEWKKVEAILRPFIDQIDGNPILLITYAISLYYYGNNKEALVYSTKALKFGNKDPYIIYHHGIILILNHKFKEAIKKFKEILDYPLQYLINGEYGGGRRWANGLILNVTYYLALALFYHDNLKDSIKYYELHLSKRSQGIACFKSKKQVIKELEGVRFLMNSIGKRSSTKNKEIDIKANWGFYL